ncbi:MAG TPA: M14 family zinc carboxypeptidase [Bacteroidales bacterium]|nr:M14 family zinc carboxypeptidase [Bacteroidales bacterium]HPS50516.1 M14 family zinc carboxypeptidase [Bacteroidales bacterium]
MKKAVLLFLSWSMSMLTLGQGWRPGEMELIAQLNSSGDLLQIQRLTKNIEPASADGKLFRIYLVPKEYELFRKLDIRYQITIPDLNLHYQHFWDDQDNPYGYYTYDQIISIIDSLSLNFPTICKKYLLGTSSGGRQLSILKISDNVAIDEPEAEIMFDGGIHGDEVGGPQNIILLARELCLNYGINPTYTDLINTREIWLYPMVNPDGRVAMSRYNSYGVDINRDCGYMWNAEGQSTGAFSQIETKTLRKIILDNQFVVYTNYHSGTEILSYPWSYRSSSARDYNLFNSLGSVYSITSGYSSLQYGQGYNVMYAINGSTKDFTYGCTGNIGWSIEISNNKQPPSSQIMTFYNNNKPAMIEMISRSNWGISGMITDSATGEPLRASIWINDYYPVYSDPEVGDFHKYIIPGNYTVKIRVNGYKTKTLTNITVPLTGCIEVNAELVPEPKWYAHQVISCHIPGNNFGDPGFTPGALGAPDGTPYALGHLGWIILDMHDTLCNGEGNDFKVIESGSASKSFTVSGSNSMDGPFYVIGTGNGTTSFDLSACPLDKVRYLRIVDNGTGAISGSGAGFNLDGVEMLTPPLIVRFTSDSDSICAENAIHFTNNCSGNPNQWNWSFPGGVPSSSSSEIPPEIHYNLPGTYDVSLTISNGFTSSSLTKQGFIKVFESPVVELGKDTALCPWQNITLDAGNPGATFLWSTGDTSQTILVDSTGIGIGSKIYWVDVSLNQICATRDSVRVTFQICSNVPKSTILPVVQIYPNPATEYFTVKTTGLSGSTWMLFSPLGIMVLNGTIGDDEGINIISTNNLKPGTYFLKIQNNISVFSGKILIHR